MSSRSRPVTVHHGVEWPVPTPGEAWTVGAIVLERDGNAFAQKRSADRRLWNGPSTPPTTGSAPATSTA
ncbi:hypothetical protein [Streptomyces sp. NRRL S-4]|uniref:hypothetical protein n=1 Tax=Streptomyces sp. NRRL S-4 TaxID=1519471 RepID=UPI001F16E17D|nr:hypothetical protein [Streptomyces sp. NRRL S-4]